MAKAKSKSASKGAGFHMMRISDERWEQIEEMVKSDPEFKARWVPSMTVIVDRLLGEALDARGVRVAGRKARTG